MVVANGKNTGDWVRDPGVARMAVKPLEANGLLKHRVSYPVSFTSRSGTAVHLVRNSSTNEIAKWKARSLLVPQGDHGIDGGGAPCGDDAGADGDEDEQGRGSEQSFRIA